MAVKNGMRPVRYFGGFRQSGHGPEAGLYWLEEFLEYKSLQLKG